MQVLHNKGILNSFKGKGGGFSLAENPKEIFLWDIMRIFQGSFCLNECFLRKRICPNIKNCILRKRIGKIESYVADELKSITIDYLIRDQKRR